MEPVTRHKPQEASGPFLPCTVLLLYEGLQWRQNPLEETDPRYPSLGTCHELPWLSSQFLCENGQTPEPTENQTIAKGWTFSSYSYSTRALAVGSRGCSTVTRSHGLEKELMAKTHAGLERSLTRLMVPKGKAGGYGNSTYNSSIRGCA